jgi:hypothetical protein
VTQRIKQKGRKIMHTKSNLNLLNNYGSYYITNLVLTTSGGNSWILCAARREHAPALVSRLLTPRRPGITIWLVKRLRWRSELHCLYFASYIYVYMTPTFASMLLRTLWKLL